MYSTQKSCRQNVTMYGKTILAVTIHRLVILLGELHTNTYGGKSCSHHVMLFTSVVLGVTLDDVSHSSWEFYYSFQVSLISLAVR